ncbi:hypothetical protein HZA85_01950 [Candidatus Uhrbacteria bacterium]|nr:hypothetical protein [Candidatus Uhrbacteria bacterium]
MRWPFLILVVLIIFMPRVVIGASVSPSVIELSGKRGEVVSSKLTIINSQSVDQTYYLGVMSFEPDETGTLPHFLSAKEDRSGFTRWLNLDNEQVVVKAQSKGEVPFELNIPVDVASGGYYGALTVSGSPSDLVVDNGASVEAKTAALIFLTVQGETMEKLALLDFFSSNRWSSDLHHSLTYRLQNQGNVHVTPQGKVSLKDVFGRTIASVDANPSQGRILPNSTRSYSVEAERPSGWINTLQAQMRSFAIGPVTAQVALSYGQTNQVIEASTSFWYVPWQLLISVILLAAIVIWLFEQASKQQKRSEKN